MIARPRSEEKSGRGPLVVLALLAALSCRSTSSPGAPVDASGTTWQDAPTAACSSCEAYQEPEDLGPVAAHLQEISGLASSRRHPGVLYTHNDSGDSARFFALGLGAELLAEYGFEGVMAEDWEDIAVGPCPEGTCVFLGDIGDNTQTRRGVRVHRVPEPELRSGALVPSTFELRYPDGPHNAETLLVHPRTGEVHVVTKSETGVSGLYRIPPGAAPGGAPLVLEKLAAFTVPDEGLKLVTGGSIHPCAARVVLRTYSGLFEYRGEPGSSLEDIFAKEPSRIVAPLEAQGEAVVYAADGRALYTASEGKAAVLHRVRCR